MRGYFYGDKPGQPDTPGYGTVSFHLPDLDITFRARYKGTALACEYAALLALLEFIEINPKFFKGKPITVYGDSFAVVNQINDRMFCEKSVQPFRNMALTYKRKIPYSLEWVPPTQNPAHSEVDKER